MRLRLVAYEATARQIFPRWEYFLPRLGMFCSQGGNFLLSVCLSKSRNALGEWRAEAVFRAKPQRTIKSGPFADAWRCCSLFCSFLLLYVDECFVLRGWPTQGGSRAAGASGVADPGWVEDCGSLGGGRPRVGRGLREARRCPRQPFRRRSRVFRVRGLLHGRCFLSLSMPHGERKAPP